MRPGGPGGHGTRVKDAVARAVSSLDRAKRSARARAVKAAVAPPSAVALRQALTALARVACHCLSEGRRDGRRGRTKGWARSHDLLLKLTNYVGLTRAPAYKDLGSYAVAGREVMPGVEHRRHKGLNNRAENSHQPTRRREKIMKRFKSARQLQRFVSIHDPIANLFHFPRHALSSADHRDLRSAAMATWHEIAHIAAA